MSFLEQGTHGERLRGAGAEPARCWQGLSRMVRGARGAPAPLLGGFTGKGNVWNRAQPGVESTSSASCLLKHLSKRRELGARLASGSLATVTAPFWQLLTPPRGVSVRGRLLRGLGALPASSPPSCLGAPLPLPPPRSLCCTLRHSPTALGELQCCQ